MKRYHYTPLRMAKIKKTANNKCWEGYVSPELSYIAHKGINCYSTLENWKYLLKLCIFYAPEILSNEYIHSLKDVEECSQ